MKIHLQELRQPRLRLQSHYDKQITAAGAGASHPQKATKSSVAESSGAPAEKQSELSDQAGGRGVG